jgi:hypothetical protein
MNRKTTFSLSSALDRIVFELNLTQVYHKILTENNKSRSRKVLFVTMFVVIITHHK